MSWTGTIRNDVVVFNVPNSIPEGTEVEVAVHTVAEEAQTSLWDRLRDVVGKAEGLPADAASRVDHYLREGISSE